MSEAQARAPAQSVGEILQRQRQEKNLGVTQIAERLRLDPRVIQALESDDYSSLPAALYVRGYLRSYARLVGLDPAALIDRYNNDSPSELPEIIPEVRHPTQTSSSDKPVQAITLLVTFLMVILVVAWWQSNFVVRPGGRGEQPPQAAELPPPSLSYPITIVRHPEDPFYRAPEEEPVPESAPPAGPGAAAPAAPAVPPAAGESGAQSTSTGPDQLTVRLSADSWVEIFDARGQKVYVSLARNGEVLSLAGTAPFSVLLGFAQGVSIEINGKGFDPAPYSRSGIARFTLDD